MLIINQTTPDFRKLCVREWGQTANQDFLMDRDRFIDQSDCRVWRWISEHVRRWHRRATLFLSNSSSKIELLFKMNHFWKFLLILKIYYIRFSNQDKLSSNKVQRHYFFSAEMNQFIFSKIEGGIWDDKFLIQINIFKYLTSHQISYLNMKCLLFLIYIRHCYLLF